MSGLQTIDRKHVVFTTLVGVCAEIINKLTPLVLVRIGQSALGMEAYGYTQYGFYLVDLFIPFILFGYTLKSIFSASEALRSHEKEGLKKKIGELVCLRLLHFLCLAVGLTYYLGFHRDDPTLLLIVLAALAINALDLSFIQFATQRLHFLSYATIVGKLACLAIIWLYVEEASHKHLFLAAILGANGFVTLVTFAFGLYRYGILLPRFAELKQGFKAAIPYGIYIAVFGISERLDMLTIEANLGGKYLGIYAGVYKLYQSLMPLIAMLSNVFFAESLRLRDKNAEVTVLEQTLRVISLVTMPMAFGIWFVSGLGIELILGHEFAPGAQALCLLVTNLALMGPLIVLTYQVFIRAEHIWPFAAYNVLYIPVLVASYPFLAQRFGLSGIAAGVLAFRSCYTLGLLIWLKKIYGRTFLLDSLVGLTPAAVMGLGLYFIKPMVTAMALLPCGAFFYLAALLILHRSEVSKVLSALKEKNRHS